MNRIMNRLVAAVAPVLACGPAATGAAPAYDREIAPILRTYCSGCHNDREAESGFSVERYAAVRRGGDAAGDPIVPGDAAASILVRRIESTAADHMPPADEPQVPAADLATLASWIAAGAPGPTVDASILETLAVPALAPARGPRPITALAFAADGGRLAVARGRLVEVFPLAAGGVAGPPLVTIGDLPGSVTAVQFTGDGRQLVLATGVAGLRGVAEIRDAAGGAVVRSFGGHRDLLYDAALSPDGTMLATAGYDRVIRLWNVADGALLRSIDVHTGAVFDVAWHPTGKLLATASADETVKLWRAADGVRLDTLSQPQGELARVTFTPDGRHVLAAGRDKRIHLWRLVSLDAPATNPAVHSRFAHEAPITALGLSADGSRLVTAAEDRTLKAWTVPDLDLVAELTPQPDLVTAIVPAGGPDLLLGRMDGGLERVTAPGRPAGRPDAAAEPAGVGAGIPTAAGKPAAEPPAAVAEAEPNDDPAAAPVVPVPVAVTGAIGTPGDVDCLRFAARAGVPLVVEVIAAGLKPASRVDSRVEVLHADGRPVEQVVLQAVRDSWLTFRGKDSTQSGDFRLHNWEEMELDEYLYVGGEVVRLWLYPRGPDSGFDVYPGPGSRHTFFHTTAVTHALGEPAWVVEPLPPGTAPVPNGLPLFRLYYENDDESTRRLGSDSQLLFVPPADGEYVARVSDVRGFGGGTDHHYTLGIRPPKPSFEVGIGGRNPQVSPGGGRELTFTVTRIEGFAGPVRIEVEGLPPGFTFHGPIEIEAGQREAHGVLSAAADAAAPDEAADKRVRVRAVADVAGVEVVRDLGDLGDLQLAGPPKLTVEILPSGDHGAAERPAEEPPVFTIRPGQTIAARVKVERHDFAGPIDFGGEAAGRNLPHGVFVDNIGLNGLLIVEGQDEREFVITAAPKARPGRRLFHLRAGPDGGQTSPPAVIEVLPPDETDTAAAAPVAAPDFARDVRPLLSNRCFKCHGPDEGNREAGLRLDHPGAATAALDSGARAIVPGRPDDSELVARITSTDPDLVMPPPHAKVSLTAAERRILTEWIAAGAAYAPHWAFVKPQRPAVPAVASAPVGWTANPIDAFVLARLEEERLAPSPAADKATLCRRVHLDLVGLPPTPAALDAFLADESPDAYERLVDGLLASPRYGERWARRWLDLARYADTNGYEKDRPREIWPYRDWVIRALNEDMPFDRFTILQIAGDLLPDAGVDELIATGFHRNTMLNEEGGIDPLEFRYLAMVDRVGTTGTVWLGLTTACAQCHTHKFDPITHADYFALMALLDNADEPEWLIPGPELDARRAAVAERIEAEWRALPARWPVPEDPPPGPDGPGGPPAAAPGDGAKRAVLLAGRFDGWSRAESDRAVRWEVMRPTAMASTMPHLVIRADGSILGGGDATKSDVYEIVLPPAPRPVRAIRLEVLPDPTLPADGPGMCGYEGPKGDFFLSEFEVRAGGGRRPIAAATDSFSGSPLAGTARATAAAAIDGEMSSGWSTDGEQGRPHAAVFQLAEPVPAGEPLTVTMRFERHYACPLGCFRLSVTDAAAAEARGHTAAEEAALLTPAPSRTPEERELIFRRFLETAAELAEPISRIRGLERELTAGVRTLVLRERPPDNPRKTFRHHRGEFTRPEEEVAPATPAFLPPLPASGPANRLALARWLVSPDNPLTARVTVNRHWQAFFGRGFVPSLEDFGHQSEPPSHPELLDWLAVTFMTDLGWSTKRLHRLIVTSATYRQASQVSPAGGGRDPANVLLARGPRVRLEAEVIRDSMLRAAGLLSTKMYGPGVRPPQPEGVTEVAYGKPAWPVSEGEDRHRRSIYTFQKRTAPFAMTTTFDGPTGESCVPRREVSNSALQALTLLNDPMFVEIAQALGRTVTSVPGDDAARLREIGRRVLSRDLDAEESAALAAFLAGQRRRLAAGDLDAEQLAGSAGPDAAERAAWTLVARAVMNLDEAIVKR